MNKFLFTKTFPKILLGIAWNLAIIKHDYAAMHPDEYGHVIMIYCDRISHHLTGGIKTDLSDVDRRNFDPPGNKPYCIYRILN